mmetsp:Transcript_1045/g.1818  ORF Transcript_1045/g.1818 Transcript_1045/m.1818 type:complete len:202 (-) Transcript_1045:442-1047(-)
MKLFGRKKKSGGQRQPQQSASASGVVEARQPQTKDIGSREVSNGAASQRQSSNRSLAQKQSPKPPPVPPRASPRSKPSPQTSILHKHAHYGGMEPPPPQSHRTSPMAAYDRSPKVRFASGGASVDSASAASKVHMMAGSFASSSAMSSSQVMTEEQKRLNALGMSHVDPKSDAARHNEDHEILNHGHSRLNAMGMSRESYR